jgi:hypothetical protein
MAITLNGTTGITTPDLTSTDDITANSSAVLTAASSLAAANLTGVLPAIDGAALTNLPIPASAVTLISIFTISTAVANVDITLPTSGYTTLSLLVTGLRSDTDGDSLYGRISSDGGATFDAGASDYVSNYTLISEMRFNSGDLMNGAGTSSSYVMYIQNRSGLFNTVYGHYTYSKVTPQAANVSFVGNMRNNYTVQANAFRLFPLLGNLTAGTFNLYGWT